MQVLNIVTKLPKYTLTDKMENRKTEMSYAGFGFYVWGMVTAKRRDTLLPKLMSGEVRTQYGKEANI